MELGGGGRRRDEGQVGTCRVDGPGAVKDRREAWTEGLGGWVTRRGGSHLGTSTSASVHEGVTVLTESRRRTCESSGAQEDLEAGRSRMAVTRIEWRGTRMEYATHGLFAGLSLKPTRWTVFGFGPQNPGGGSEEERTARGGIEEFVSR